MALDDMLKALEEEGKQQQGDILETSRAQAREIIKAAEAQASDIEQAHLDKMNKAINDETTKLLAEAKIYVDRKVSKAKEEMIEDAFDQADDKLSKIRYASDYVALFEQLLREALSQAEGSVVVHVDPHDAALARDVKEKTAVDYQIELDLDNDGGMEVTAENGRITIANTIESRGDRARRFMKSEVAASLYR